MLVVYFNLLLSSYNSLWNNYSLTSNQLCNHLHDLLQSFIRFWIIFNWLIKKVFSINHNTVIFCFYSQKKISVGLVALSSNCICLVNLVGLRYLQMIKQKVYLLLENLCHLNYLNIGLSFLLILLLQSIVLLKPDFDCSSSFVLSWVDKVTTGT